MAKSTFPRPSDRMQNPQVVYSRIGEVKNSETRNALRGIVSRRKRKLDASEINLIRAQASSGDLALAIEILLGKRGSMPFSNLNVKYRNLLARHGLDPISPAREVQFAIGRINGWPANAIEVIGSVMSLAPLPQADVNDALNALQVFAKRWGASNYLARKLAYAISREDEQAESHPTFEAISQIVGHHEYSLPYFTALESIDLRFPYFTGMNTRLLLLKKYLADDDDFRQWLPLHNIAPCPMSENDVGAFIRKAHSMSFVDEVIALLQIYYLRDQWQALGDAIQLSLRPEILSAFSEIESLEFDCRSLFAGAEPDDADFIYYRNSLAFLEFAEPTRFRAHVDSEIGRRLINRLDLKKCTSGSAPPRGDFSKRDLLKSLHGFHTPNDYMRVQTVGTFLRTFQFLNCVHQRGRTLSFNQQELRFILQRTQSLEILLTADEIDDLYLGADETSKQIVTVLALALHKVRSHDDDVDFKFRMSLADTVINRFDSNILKFINWLLLETPEIANFLIGVLDQATLQKLYWIVRSADDADRIRQEILRSVGKNTENISYLIEADTIEAHRKVLTLQKYFDDSRMYVDSAAMKRWLINNPTAYAQQYIRLIERSGETVGSRAVAIIRNDEFYSSAQLTLFSAYDYVLHEVAKTAFEQFCTNPQFGIESYLGRRIRHNTLMGMMKDGVDNLIEKPVFRTLSYDDAFGAANDRWREEYTALIEKLRRDILQFRSQSKPRGFLRSELTLSGEQTAMNIIKLREASIAARSSEVFHDLVIRFCWTEINPQLTACAMTIQGSLATEAYQSIAKVFANFNDPIHGQYKTELQNEVFAKFARLASWFRQPESGFVAASVREIGDLIAVEASRGMPASATFEWSGDFDLRLDGPSVHRLYDCMFIVMMNAAKYRNPGTVAEIAIRVDRRVGSQVAIISVSICSQLTDDVSQRGDNIKKLQEAFAAEDTAASMIKEGYSGIKKLRFLTNLYEGRSTAGLEVDNKTCSVRFQLSVELAKNSDSPDQQ